MPSALAPLMSSIGRSPTKTAAAGGPRAGRARPGRRPDAAWCAAGPRCRPGRRCSSSTPSRSSQRSCQRPRPVGVRQQPGPNPPLAQRHQQRRGLGVGDGVRSPRLQMGLDGGVVQGGVEIETGLAAGGRQHVGRRAAAPGRDHVVPPAAFGGGQRDGDLLGAGRSSGANTCAATRQRSSRSIVWKGVRVPPQSKTTASIVKESRSAHRLTGSSTRQAKLRPPRARRRRRPGRWCAARRCAGP